jgi:four helix bundle protein
MRGQNLIPEKSHQFDLKIINLFLHWKEKKAGRTLLFQLLKARSSIGGNTEEAIGAQNKEACIMEFSIANRKARTSKEVDF